MSSTTRHIMFAATAAFTLAMLIALSVAVATLWHRQNALAIRVQPTLDAMMVVASLERQRRGRRQTRHIGNDYEYGYVVEWPIDLTLRRFRDRFPEKLSEHTDEQVAAAAWQETMYGADSKDLHKDEWVDRFLERIGAPLVPTDD